MGQQQIAGVAVLVAMAFLIMALSACASSEQAQFAPVLAADPIDAPAEFHDAHISNDALRDRLGSE
ncbi:hypothetical protein DSM104635_01681 [Terricaulis silvestris]|uniref:Lipoprotein n=2 Tax=Terricaulis silvestris TaxID=2686094 RepID=A0A6I6MJK6_9CAUL|nr:hypothetical protein DSM104635_01681 [Terricaulis silvestris]